MTSDRDKRFSVGKCYRVGRVDIERCTTAGHDIPLKFHFSDLLAINWEFPNGFRKRYEKRNLRGSPQVGIDFRFHEWDFLGESGENRTSKRKLKSG